MKTLLLIPSAIETDSAHPRPRQDYEALAAVLNEDAAGGADLLDLAAAAQDHSPAVRLARRWGGQGAALAMLGFQRRHQYDVLLSLGEEVGVPLSLMLNMARTRPGHVFLARSLSAAHRLPWTLLKAHRGLDTIFVHAQCQQDFAEDHLGFPGEKLALIPPPLDEHFYRPGVGQPAAEDQLGAVGWKGRDYGTLAQALVSMPDLAVGLAASPPAPHALHGLDDRATLRPDSPAERRALYARSQFVVVPLRDADFPVGAGAILEAMAMGKAVIATRTHGQAELIIEGVTGLSVAPGDVTGWRQAIARLRGDAALRERLGHNARRWVEENATMERWAERVRHALRDAAVGETGARISPAYASSLPIFW